MKYEQEYMPDVTEMEDVVHILHNGKAEAVDVPDDDGDPEDEEGAPKARLAASTSAVPPRSCDAVSTAGQPTDEEEPHADYD